MSDISFDPSTAADAVPNPFSGDTSWLDQVQLPTTFPVSSGPSSLPAVTPPAGGIVGSFNDVIGGLTNAVTSVYGSLAKIEQAKAGVAVARAQGQNAVQTARAGLPSPQLLLLGGLGLVAVLALSGGHGGRRR